ncbi:unnamed protein product [Prorocentrum cordatum]|uniref:Uncharacterized protein n=1 Tax=Prorocentrum cordatum TaxID=2364126 RepID=A0ABN9X5D9_9DINO|nr:unnamed protein product [Polarella glacialis]
MSNAESLADVASVTPSPASDEPVSMEADSSDDAPLRRTQSQAFKRIKIDEVAKSVEERDEPVQELRKALSQLCRRRADADADAEDLATARERAEEQLRQVERLQQGFRNFGEDLMEGMLAEEDRSDATPRRTAQCASRRSRASRASWTRSTVRSRASRSSGRGWPQSSSGWARSPLWPRRSPGRPPRRPPSPRRPQSPGAPAGPPRPRPRQARPARSQGTNLMPAPSWATRIVGPRWVHVRSRIEGSRAPPAHRWDGPQGSAGPPPR